MSSDVEEEEEDNNQISDNKDHNSDSDSDGAPEEFTQETGICFHLYVDLS